MITNPVENFELEPDFFVTDERYGTGEISYNTSIIYYPQQNEMPAYTPEQQELLEVLRFFGNIKRIEIY